MVQKLFLKKNGAISSVLGCSLARFSSLFLAIFFIFHPLILLVRHAVPTESIGEANAAPAAPLPTPMVLENKE